MDPLDLIPVRDVPWLRDRTVYLVRHGSQAYGTSTPTSDLDLRACAVPPAKYLLGYLNRFEQSVFKEPNDLTVFSLHKFAKLAADGNPNVLELLYVDDEDVLYASEVGRVLREYRHLFLSKKIKHTMTGYAHAQLKRIRGHRQWLLKPPTKPPVRADFDLPERTVIPADQLATATSLIRKQVESWQLSLDGIDDASRIEFEGRIARTLTEMQLTSDAQWTAAGRVIGLSENFLAILDRERAYASSKAQWDQYNQWKSERNEARAALEAQYGYDCFTDDTDFLTENGWKSFDAVTVEDKLATVYIGDAKHRPMFGVEYQSYTEKFDGTLNGNMYQLSAYHYDVMTTPNHRMLVAKKERVSSKKSDWDFVTAANLPDTFEVLRTITPKEKTYGTYQHFDGLPIPYGAYLRLMGWYLSDGCANMSGDDIKSIRISQKTGGRLHGSMQKFANKYKDLGVALYAYDRDPTAVRPYAIEEQTLVITNDVLRNRMLADCGRTVTKRIPRWVFALSKYAMEMLFDAMCAGDGTIRGTLKTNVYYTSLKGIADDVCELAVLCGWETSVYGPYKNTTEIAADGSVLYHVHVNKNVDRTRTLMRNQNVRRVPVTNQRIVCFSVPNSTLIVRRNGQVAIHGNCKHGMHLIRLMRMCLETLTTGTVNVRRPDAKDLLRIRNGALTYDELMVEAERLSAEVEVAYTTTALPHEPDRAAIDEIVMECTHSMLY